MALHIFNKSPSSTEAFLDCLKAVTSSDSLLFIDDAVYSLQWCFADTEQNHLKELNVFYLDESIHIRGIKHCQSNQADYTVIDYEGFVALCETNSPVVSW